MKNFKVRCVEPGYGFEKEKLYEVKDGNLIDDDRDDFGKFESVEEINEYLCSKFELVEEEKKTPFQYMLDYYNIKVGEVFKFDGEEVYFDEDGNLLYKDGAVTIGFKNKCYNGTANVEKLPWKPKDNDKVWKIDAEGFVYEGTFTESLLSNISLLKLGWIFQTKEEAEANKERVFAEMKEVLK